VVDSPSQLFSIEPAEMIRYARLQASPGDMIFHGKNPPAGAIIDYYLKEAAGDDDIELSVHDASGNPIQELEPTKDRGINRVVWSLRYERYPAPAGAEPSSDGRPPQGPEGPFVMPGTYTIRLSVGDQTHEKTVEVLDDPRLDDVTPADRREWTDTLLEIGEMYRSANVMTEQVLGVEEKISKIDNPPAETAEETAALHKLTFELRRRVRNLYGSVGGWTGPPTAEQRKQMTYLVEAAKQIQPRVRALTESGLP
jgi:hypothetical protein